ncbi:hypothetical protein HDU92_003587 [Lobulomyces angularis]|nr:hypothetical protein HDU92_003587 [Lobulomyces angularis]
MAEEVIDLSESLFSKTSKFRTQKFQLRLRNVKEYSEICDSLIKSNVDPDAQLNHLLENVSKYHPEKCNHFLTNVVEKYHLKPNRPAALTVIVTLNQLNKKEKISEFLGWCVTHWKLVPDRKIFSYLAFQKYDPTSFHDSIKMLYFGFCNKVVNSIEIFNRLIKSYDINDDSDRQKILNLHKYMMNIYVENRDYKNGKEFIVDSLKDGKLEGNIDTYIELLSCLKEVGSHSEFEEVLNKIKNLEVTLKLPSLNSLINIFLDLDRLDEVIHFFKATDHHIVRTFNPKKVLQRWKGNSFFNEIFSYYMDDEIATEIFHQNQDLTSACNILKATYFDNCILPTAATLQVLCQVLLENKSWKNFDEIWEYLERSSNLNIQLYNLAFESDNVDDKRFQKYYQSFLNSSISPDFWTITTLIKKFASLKKYQNAFTLYEDLLRNNNSTNTSILEDGEHQILYELIRVTDKEGIYVKRNEYLKMLHVKFGTHPQLNGFLMIIQNLISILPKSFLVDYLNFVKKNNLILRETTQEDISKVWNLKVEPEIQNLLIEIARNCTEILDPSTLIEGEKIMLTNQCADSTLKKAILPDNEALFENVSDNIIKKSSKKGNEGNIPTDTTTFFSNDPVSSSHYQETNMEENLLSSNVNHFSKLIDKDPQNPKFVGTLDTNQSGINSVSNKKDIQIQVNSVSSNLSDNEVESNEGPLINSITQKKQLNIVEDAKVSDKIETLDVNKNTDLDISSDNSNEFLNMINLEKTIQPQKIDAHDGSDIKNFSETSNVSFIENGNPGVRLTEDNASSEEINYMTSSNVLETKCFSTDKDPNSIKSKNSLLDIEFGLVPDNNCISADLKNSDFQAKYNTSARSKATDTKLNREESTFLINVSTVNETLIQNNSMVAENNVLEESVSFFVDEDSLSLPKENLEEPSNTSFVNNKAFFDHFNAIKLTLEENKVENSKIESHKKLDTKIKEDNIDYEIIPKKKIKEKPNRKEKLFQDKKTDDTFIEFYTKNSENEVTKSDTWNLLFKNKKIEKKNTEINNVKYLTDVNSLDEFLDICSEELINVNEKPTKIKKKSTKKNLEKRKKLLDVEKSQKKTIREAKVKSCVENINITVSSKKNKNSVKPINDSNISRSSEIDAEKQLEIIEFEKALLKDAKKDFDMESKGDHKFVKSKKQNVWNILFKKSSEINLKSTNSNSSTDTKIEDLNVDGKKLNYEKRLKNLL